MLRTRFLKRSFLVTAMVVPMLFVSISGAFAEEASIESLVNSGEAFNCLKATDSEVRAASVAQDGENVLDYKTATTKEKNLSSYEGSMRSGR